MELSNVARIGKGILTKAIGLQHYKEIYSEGTEQLDELRSGCYNCPIYKTKKDFQIYNLAEPYDYLQDQCHCCSDAVYKKTYKVSYINEKNRYGYQPTLKSNAIKLLLLYHFLQPDSLGLVKNINQKELATTLNCTLATVKASNEILQNFEYCYISSSGIDDCIHVWLPDYKNYHLTAKEGGRGYLTLSNQLLNEIISIKPLNTLRLNIRGILEVDNTSSLQTKDSKIAKANYKQLRSFLPDYCKRNVIQKALKDSDNIFKLTLQTDGVIFKIKEDYTQPKLREEMKLSCRQNISQYIDNVNKLLHIANNETTYDQQERAKTILSLLSYDTDTALPPIVLDPDAINSLASMCLQYSYEIVKQAIPIAYNSSKDIKNWGGFIRQIIKNRVTKLAS